MLTLFPDLLLTYPVIQLPAPLALPYDQRLRIFPNGDVVLSKLLVVDYAASKLIGGALANCSAEQRREPEWRNRAF